MIGYQLWGFFSPALHKHEKRVIVPTLFGMVILFLSGVSLCYFVVLPFTLKFFHGFESTSLTPMIEATEYFDFAFSMMLAFGVAFELPIGILLLSALGIVEPRRSRGTVGMRLWFALSLRRSSLRMRVRRHSSLSPDHFISCSSWAYSFRISSRESDGSGHSRRSLEARRASERPEAVPREPRRLGVKLETDRRLPRAARRRTGRCAGDSSQADTGSDRPPKASRYDTPSRLDARGFDSCGFGSCGFDAAEGAHQVDSRRLAHDGADDPAGIQRDSLSGRKVTFNAKQRTLYLEGDPAGVSRGVTILVGDTITYNDSTKIVFARGDTLILRDPSRGSSDVIALGQMTYNVESRRGNVTNISTSVESGETWYVFSGCRFCE